MNYQAIDYLLNYYGVWKLRYLLQKVINKRISFDKYGNNKILIPEIGNNYIKQMILSNKPFMAGRFGSTELSTVVESIGVSLGINKTVNGSIVHSLCNLSGFFPQENNAIMKFSELMIDLTHEADFLGVWFNFMEDYVVKKYSNKLTLSQLKAIEPYYFSNPWSSALEGKKVLVIHPFELSIQKQYLKREKLFKDNNVLPKFNLITQKAVQTIAGQKSEYVDWFEALDYMYNEAISTDFDIALIGCGAYGFPLAAMLKRAGKQSIHMAGATQVLFGIKGSRWDNHPIISKLYNKYWVRPEVSEVPKDAKFVENGCYW